VWLQWLRSRARANRWDEEVELLVVEMRRVARFLEYERERWNSAAKRRDVSSEVLPAGQGPLMEGLTAYAYRQADLRNRLRCHFDHLWHHVDQWKQDPGAVPTVRHWFSSMIEPDKSPWLYNYQLS
jgi:hypothetical protein